MASDSCGNPAVIADSIMDRRPKFDKSKSCVRCKENLGNIVVRHAVYCKECFPTLLSNKVKRSLEPFINASPGASRKKSLKASGNLLIAFSGGLGSTVLLDLITRMYFPSESDAERQPGTTRGGKKHPRNELVWQKAAVCYVEVCNGFPGMRDRTNEVAEVLGRYGAFEFIPLRLEQAFDTEWWKAIGGKPSQDVSIDVASEDLFVSKLSNDSLSDPVERLRSYISALPTHTAVLSAVQTLIRLLLLHTARSTSSSHLLFGTSLTSLSISLISSISQGGGFTVREEAQEEWTAEPSSSDSTTPMTIRLLKPLQEVTMKECSFWVWWNHLFVVGKDKPPGGRHSIGALTKDFIMGLEKDYPSTVSTIARTCSKLAPKAGAQGTCILCERPLQRGVQEWKARISIRAMSDTPLDNAASLTPYLCYSCHTTLTSRSSRTVSSSSNSSLHFPVWVRPHLDDIGFIKGLADNTDEEVRGAGSEIWGRKKVGEEEMKNILSEFLLE